ncbi:MAG TPA: hypothetical protein DCP73_00805, partial [Chloroflexi bacterium]|nr:hypothetical protein [Chloroflexota bacterium]
DSKASINPAGLGSEAWGKGQVNRSPDVPFGRLIPVPAGDHLIEMTFNPPSTRLGLTVSGVGVMVAAFLIAIRPSPDCAVSNSSDARLPTVHRRKANARKYSDLRKPRLIKTVS